MGYVNNTMRMMKLLLLITIMLFFTACGSTRTVPVATVVEASDREWIIITDKCTSYATWTPEYGLVFKVSDVLCGDYNATIGAWITREVPGSSVMVEGEQWIMLRVSQVDELYKKLGDMNVIKFISRNEYQDMSEEERSEINYPTTTLH